MRWSNFVGLSANNIKDPKKVYDEIDSLEDTELSSKLFNHSLNSITKKVDQVFDKTKYGDKDWNLVNKLRKDAAKFSAYRTAQYTANLKGKTEEERSAIIALYERHLATESNFASRTARSAKQWNSFKQSQADYPNLEYLPSRSAEQRAEHKQFYGIIKPMNDPFWDTHLPPNGWNCKCRVRKSDEVPTSGEVETTPLPDGIIGNAGKSERLFGSNNSYEANLSVEGKKTALREMNRLSLNLPYPGVDYKKGSSSISVHTFADQNKTKKTNKQNSLQENFEAAKLIADNFDDVEIKIRPHAENVETGFGDTGRRNPEYLINGRVGDLKKIEGNSCYNGYNSAKNKQHCKVVVFRIDTEVSIQRIQEQLNGKIKKSGKNPFERIFIIKGSEIAEYKKRD